VTAQPTGAPSAAPPPGDGVVRIGAGAGFAGDRYEPAELLARLGGLDALAFECLAERTIAVAQQARLDGSSEGWDRRILRRLSGTLPHLLGGRAVVTTNAGAANPAGAARAIVGLIDSLDLPRVPVAAVSGDDVLGRIDLRSARIWGSDDTLHDIRDRIVSVNAYTGAGPLVEALDRGARVVVTGRCGDAALFAAPLVHRFGWDADDLDLAARATLVGHLLECAGQLTGGYFADGGRKAVDGLWNLGFPMADVDASGTARYTKLPGSGGLLDRRTVLEQLLYEIDDPRSYRTPDVTLDLGAVDIREDGPDAVTVSGARAAGRPDELKASVGVRDGFLALAEIGYAGGDCVARAELAARILRERWSRVHGRDDGGLEHVLIGVDAMRPWWDATPATAPEVRLRLSLRTFDREAATALCDEVEALYTNGPAGGGGVATSVRETIGIVSTLVPREAVEPRIEVLR
jgi:hypothetical protein